MTTYTRIIEKPVIICPKCGGLIEISFKNLFKKHKCKEGRGIFEVNNATGEALKGYESNMKWFLRIGLFCSIVFLIAILIWKYGG